MRHLASRREIWVSAVRWLARVWSAVTIALVLAFIVGERSLPSRPSEWLGFLFFPFGICVGMIVAWKKENLGGLITVGSLLAAYVLHFAATGALLKGWAWLAFAAPGFLFLLSSQLSRGASAGGLSATPAWK